MAFSFDQSEGYTDYLQRKHEILHVSSRKLSNTHCTAICRVLAIFGQ